MREITQTLLHDPDGDPPVVGNCFATSLACILDTNIPENFCDDASRWVQRTQAWLSDRGLTYIDIDPKAMRWTLDWCDCYHVISGMSPRGVRHSVVGYKEELVWDPHPSRDGLLDADGIKERRIEFGFLVYQGFGRAVSGTVDDRSPP